MHHRIGTILNRVVRRAADGWESAPHHRHAAMVIAELGLKDSKHLITPGETDMKEGSPMNDHYKR